MVGEWRLDDTAPSIIRFGDDGAGSFGSCDWRWTLDVALTVDGWPADPYACLDGSTDHTSSRLVELLVNGPAEARISDDGTQLYLIDDQFVIQLDRVDNSDASLPSTAPSTTAPIEVPQGLHDWPAPTTSATPIGAIPALLPTVPVPNATDVVRSEYASDGSGFYDYIQTWFDPDRDAYVVVTTNLAQVTTATPEFRQPVDTAGWTNEWGEAFFSTNSPPYTTLTLVDDGGFVVLHAFGLTRAEVSDLASSMRRRTLPQPGWELPDLKTSFRPFAESGHPPPAGRRVVWLQNTSTLAELSVSTESAEAMQTGWYETSTIDTINLDGVTAVVSETDGRVAIAWSTVDGLEVLFGYQGDRTTAESIARSLGPVDDATWRTFARERQPNEDGCTSLFC